MSNPVLSEKVFQKESAAIHSTTMTIKGTAMKSLVLVLMVLAGASYTWKVFYQAIDPSSVTPWMWGGAIGGFVTAIIISFKPQLAQYLAPVYAVLQGLFLGAISATFNSAFAQSAPGIVMNATLLTIITALVMLVVYKMNIIKVDGKFAKVMLIAIGSIAFYYIISIILGMFGVNLTML
ncbi:MAG: Bax inhibitor-1/YccA family protein, partial [Bacteroidales bacterium]